MLTLDKLRRVYSLQPLVVSLLLQKVLLLTTAKSPPPPAKIMFNPFWRQMKPVLPLVLPIQYFPSSAQPPDEDKVSASSSLPSHHHAALALHAVRSSSLTSAPKSRPEQAFPVKKSIRGNISRAAPVKEY